MALKFRLQIARDFEIGGVCVEIISLLDEETSAKSNTALNKKNNYLLYLPHQSSSRISS